MALTPFAALESRLNRAVTTALANAEASFDGGEPVAVVFDDKFSSPLRMESSDPTLRVAATLVPGIRQGMPVQVREVEYEVAEIQPDGTGLVLVRLVEA